MSDLPANMTAAYITGYGPAEDIRVGELDVPEPGPTDVLVRTEALAVNAVDTFVRSGAYSTTTPSPFVIGRDLVGTVAATGAGATRFRVGDRVWCNSLGHDGRQGSFAQFALVPVERLYRLALGVDPFSAVSVLHTAATAHLGLFREARLRVGETIVVGGAGGGVGSAVVQLAVAAGARVLATAAAPDADWCRSCGAEQVIDYRDPHAAGRIRDATPHGVDVYFDTSGHQDFDSTIPLLAQGGRVIVMAGLSGHTALPVGALYTRDASLRGFAISNASAADLAAGAVGINALLATGELRGRISARLPLREAARAHQLQEHPDQRAAPGRIVVVP